MIWAAASMTLFDGQTLSQLIAQGTPSAVVNQVSYMLLGSVFGFLAILGVIVLPISSGLSAFRSLRNIMAEYIHLPQNKIRNVLVLTIPIFVISFILTLMDFNALWRYFNWANQVTAVISLFVSTRYLRLKGRNFIVTLIPGIFMLYACVVYILSEPIGLNLGLTPLCYGLSLAVSLGLLGLLYYTGSQKIQELPSDSPLLNDHLPITTPNT
mgnify:FL=1